MKKKIFVNENVSHYASEGANCKWKFSVWSTELFVCSRPLIFFFEKRQSFVLHNTGLEIFSFMSVFAKSS